MPRAGPRLAVIAAALAVGTALVLGSGAVAAVQQGVEERLGASGGSDLQATTSLLKRYDATMAEASRVLQWRDDDPSLAQDASWKASSARVSQEFQAEYRDALAMAPAAQAGDVHACIAEALRLSSDGYDMLGVGAGQSDGHRAYYLGSHGNWDLNLGTSRMGECKRQLAAGAGGAQASAGSTALADVARARRIVRLVGNKAVSTV